MLKNWIVDRSTARDFTVTNSFVIQYVFFPEIFRSKCVTRRIVCAKKSSIWSKLSLNSRASCTNGLACLLKTWNCITAIRWRSNTLVPRKWNGPTKRCILTTSKKETNSFWMKRCHWLSCVPIREPHSARQPVQRSMVAPATTELLSNSDWPHIVRGHQDKDHQRQPRQEVQLLREFPGTCLVVVATVVEPLPPSKSHNAPLPLTDHTVQLYRA